MNEMKILRIKESEMDMEIKPVMEMYRLLET